MSPPVNCEPQAGEEGWVWVSIQVWSLLPCLYLRPSLQKKDKGLVVDKVGHTQAGSVWAGAREELEDGTLYGSMSLSPY